MPLYVKSIRKFLRAWPGKKYFGEYRFLPIFFVAGGALEFLMINWHVGETNFYKVYKRRKIQELVEQRERGDLFKKGVLRVKVHPQ